MTQERLDKILADHAAWLADCLDEEAGDGEVAHERRSMIGSSTRGAGGDPGTVERSRGKAKRVVDLRPKE